MASLYVKDEEANALAEALAKRRGLTKTAAVKLALANELAREAVARRPLRERMEDLWKRHPLPPETGVRADKAFFDELSGDL
jgi:antitoxin VapB